MSLLLELRSTTVFSPASLFASAQGGCWYDPSDLLTLFQDTAGTVPVTASGQSVARINDKSGNGNHLLQSTSGKRATYQSSGGVSSLQFDGTDDCYQTSGALNLSAYGQLGVITAFKPSSTSTLVLAELGPNVNSTADTFYVAAANDPGAGQISVAISDNSGSADGVATTASAYGSGVTSVISYQSLDITNASAAARMPMRRNGASEPVTISNDIGGAGTTFASGQVLNLGSRNGTSFFFAGDFYGLIIRGGAFTSTELNNVEAWETAKTVAGSTSYSLSCTAGSFALTGSTAALRLTRRLSGTTATYALTGAAAALHKGFRLTGSAGSFVATGNAAGIMAQRKLVAVSAGFVLTANTAALKKGFALAGTAASFSLTGNAASVLKGFRLTATSASFALTGQVIALKVGRALSAGPGVFTLTGNAAALERGIRLAVTSGSVALTGQSATLIHGTVGAFTLSASVGAFALTGNPAGLIRSLVLSASPGSFALTGLAITIVAARRLAGSNGAFLLTGNSALLTRQAGLGGAVGMFQLTASPIGLQTIRRLDASVATFALTGLAARLVTITLPTPESRRVAGVVVARTAAGTITDRHITGNLQPRRAAG